MINTRLEKAELDGVLVEVFRSIVDGRIVIHIDTSMAKDEDHHTPGGTPKIRIGVNDSYTELGQDGWKEVD
jgi:hypothetical protein